MPFRIHTLYAVLLFVSIIACSKKSSLPVEVAKPADTVSISEKDTLLICSFNIKFVGLYTQKDNQALAQLLQRYDIVLVQELVSPPRAGTFPDGSSYEADTEAKAFADAMTAYGFSYLLSSEDTGTGDNIHSNASSTEWYIVFYKPNSVNPASDLANDFLADDRSNHQDYERVPHAFSFRTKDEGLDFTLISVHLKPGPGPSERARRAEELAAIAGWIAEKDETEKDLLIVGDMNIYKKEELIALLPAGYQSLNAHCVSTTVSASGNPYDHVMYSELHTSEDMIPTFTVVNLEAEMRAIWQGPDDFPPIGNIFYQYFSDHNPVVFSLVSDGEDDD